MRPLTSKVVDVGCSGFILCHIPDFGFLGWRFVLVRMVVWTHTGCSGVRSTTQSGDRRRNLCRYCRMPRLWRKAATRRQPSCGHLWRKKLDERICTYIDVRSSSILVTGVSLQMGRWKTPMHLGFLMHACQSAGSLTVRRANAHDTQLQCHLLQPCQWSYVAYFVYLSYFAKHSPLPI